MVNRVGGEVGKLKLSRRRLTRGGEGRELKEGEGSGRWERRGREGVGEGKEGGGGK